MKPGVLTRVDFADFDGVPWVKWHRRQGYAYCDRCDVVEDIALPREAVQFAERFRTFALAHAGCQLPQEAIETEQRSRKRVLRYE